MVLERLTRPPGCGRASWTSQPSLPGTHVSAALVDVERGLVSERRHRALDSSGSLDSIVSTLAAVAAELPVTAPTTWAVAMPGPFHYEHGIGDFRGADKFHALEDVDLRAALIERVPSMLDARFLNDAAAFGLGEAGYGAGRGADRVFVMTLGTGLGSAFVEHGRLVESGDRVPPRGWLFEATLDGRPLEDLFSRRALIERYPQRTGREQDVVDLAAAVDQDPDAHAVFDEAYADLARGLTPWLDRFAPNVLAIGGSIAQSWGLIEQFFIPRVAPSGLVVRPTELSDDAPMLGAARWLVGGQLTSLF